jgi:uncharacterized protein with beta-barrel porin domain
MLGLMDGGGDSGADAAPEGTGSEVLIGVGDTLAIQLSGVSAAKRAEIQALLESLGSSGDPGSFLLHGDTYSFVNFENYILDTSSYEEEAGSDNERSIGRYLDNLTWFSNDMTVLFCALDSSGDVGGVLSQLGPEIYNIYPEIAYRNALYAGAAQDRRLSHLRGVGGMSSDLAGLFSSGGVELADAGKNAGLPAGQKTIGRRWAVWAMGLGVFADKDSCTDVTGYKARTGGGVGGADYRLDENFCVGVSGMYAYTTADFDLYGSWARAKSWSVGAYMSYENSLGIYVDASVSGGLDDFDTRRTISIGGLRAVARSEHDGSHIDARLGAGWMKKIGAHFTVGPTFALQYVRLDQGAIREHGAGDLSLRIHGRDTDSLASLLGFRAAARFEADGGKVEWNPELRARWVHEFLDGYQDILARFAPDPSGSFKTDTDKNHDSCLLGVGVSATVNKRFSGYVQYDADLFRRDGFTHGVGAGLRIKF